MNTPNNKPIIRIGLSRNSGSIKKRSNILTPSITPNSNSTETTPRNSSLASNSKQISKKTIITKKKLEFAAKKHLESDDEDEQDLETMDLESLKALIEKKRERLAALEKHQAEKQNLIEITEKWKQAGLEAMERLRNYKQATDEEILDSFKIPHEFFL